MENYCLRILVVACCVAMLSHAHETVAGDAQQRLARLRRLDRIIYAPRATHSLEWAVDSSDAIVTAVIPRAGKPLTVRHVLKPVGKMDVNWPPSDKDKFDAIVDLYQPGDEIMFCLRFDETGKSSHIYHYFPLISLKDPRRSLGRDEYYRTLAELDPKTKMYVYRRSIYAGFWHLNIDKEGEVIRDPDDLLKRVNQRIAAGSRVPADCDRRAVEQGKSVYGGFDLYIPLDDDLSAAEFPTVVVPPEPEYRELFFRPKEVGLRRVTEHLLNYPDDEVVAKLREMLDDRTVCERVTDVSNGSVRHSITYQWTESQTFRKFDGEDEGQVKVERIFCTRKRTYEILSRMGVEVARPNLIPE